MKIYHGTSEDVARKALTDGLKPRHMTATKGNWAHSVVSRPDAVYLTTAYAPYFGICASEWKGKKTQRIAVIEIETDLLDQNLLHPDEDFLEQATRGKDEVKGDMKKRTAYYKRNAHKYAHHWQMSADNLGTCCYAGVIPPEAITRIAFWDPASNGTMAGSFLDPTITIMNYKFCAEKYKATTRWMFGEKITPEEFVGYKIPEEAKEMFHLPAIQETIDNQMVEVISIPSTIQELALCVS